MEDLNFKFGNVNIWEKYFLDLVFKIKFLAKCLYKSHRYDLWDKLLYTLDINDKI